MLGTVISVQTDANNPMSLKVIIGYGNGTIIGTTTLQAYADLTLGTTTVNQVVNNFLTNYGSVSSLLNASPSVVGSVFGTTGTVSKVKPI